MTVSLAISFPDEEGYVPFHYFCNDSEESDIAKSLEEGVIHPLIYKALRKDFPFGFIISAYGTEDSEIYETDIKFFH